MHLKKSVWEIKFLLLPLQGKPYVKRESYFLLSNQNICKFYKYFQLTLRQIQVPGKVLPMSVTTRSPIMLEQNWMKCKILSASYKQNIKI